MKKRCRGMQDSGVGRCLGFTTCDVEAGRYNVAEKKNRLQTRRKSCGAGSGPDKDIDHSDKEQNDSRWRRKW